MEQKIGILLPRSDMFPTLAMDFLNGLKMAFKNSMLSEFQLIYIIEGIGNASNNDVIKAAEKMLLQENVDITIAFCGSHILSDLVGIFNNYKKPLIHVDLGGNMLKPEHVSPYVLHHSLNLCHSAYLAGTYAAKTFGKKAMMAASIYDGAYHHTHSFVEGYTSQGGTVTNFYVAPMDYKAETYDKMMEGIEREAPDVVFGLFSYKEGQKVFDILANSKFNGKIPFMVIPTMADETINTENYKLQDIYSIASWAFDDSRPAMKEFVSEYAANYSEKVNIIALLGYEVGQTITKCLLDTNSIPKNIKETFQNKHIDSPRGPLSYNARNESQIPSHAVRRFRFNETSYHNDVLELIDNSQEEDLYFKFDEVPYSGWQNPYICT